MPNTREKLIELLKAVVVIQECGFGDPRPTYETVARYLIAHGVTLQDGEDNNVPTKWISVKDMLPEPFVSVLVQMPGEQPFPTVREGFISNDGSWQSAMFRRAPGEVTHWQPMPQPPKEDNK